MTKPRYESIERKMKLLYLFTFWIAGAIAIAQFLSKY
jgi:hypothetical protein